MPKSKPLTTGTTLQNRYRIVKELGRGGFGAVYRAWDTRLNVPCALKENLDAALESQEQFEREARMLAKLSHPNLPRVTDHFFIRSQGQYLVMDFIDGQDLQEKLDKQGGPLLENDVLNWFNQIIDALNYLHTQKKPIIHRDIKPKNIIIRPDNTAFLVDFGIAKEHDPGLDTTVGAQAFTPGYSPIEQYGHGKTDQRSDVYSLGATMYSCLTGQVPPISISRMQDAHMTNPAGINPRVSPQTDAAIMKAMAVMQQYRFQSVIDFRFALHMSDFYTSPKRDVVNKYNTEPDKQHPSNPSNWTITIGIFSILIIIGLAIWFSAGPVMLSFFQDDTTPTNTTTLSIVEVTPTLTIVTEPVIIETTQVVTDTPVPSPVVTEEIIEPTPIGGGGLIAYNSNKSGNNEIYVMNNDGSGEIQLTFNPQDDRVPSWSPDGKMIAYQSYTSNGYEIFYLEIENGVSHQVTFNNWNDYAPSWSPDGNKFVFYSDEDGNREIYTIDIDGGNRTQLTQTTNTYNWFPTWSPDGNRITYSSNFSGKYMVYVMNADGSGKTALQHGCISSYSPDGELIVYTTYCQDNGDIHLMNADGSNPQIITEYDENTNPAFSLDGKNIVFQSEIDGNIDIWKMDLSGNNWTQLTTDPAIDAAPVWQS